MCTARPHSAIAVCSKLPSAAALLLLQVGSYFSTKVWSFTMRHHCGCKITITTDPKNAEYIVTAGARRKIETYDPDDAQVCGEMGTTLLAVTSAQL